MTVVSEQSISKAARFRHMLRSPELAFIMEAHNGLSAKIVEETGFEGIWASGLTMSAALGVRDNNEASWTQVLEVLEFMSDATRIPVMLDGDTGYGNFNNMRRLVTKLCQRDVAAVCIEDKLFPKTNSFLGEAQPLADVDEFCGKIKAGKDSQLDPDFSVVARIEALISGWDMDEALSRAEAYHHAGADAILIHSKKHNADEILTFMRLWGGRCPVVIVPTMYYSTPTARFRDAGVAMIIWANHNLRAAIDGMRETSRRILVDQSLIGVEDTIAPVRDVFRLQGNDELEEAEGRYLPRNGAGKAILLAASRGRSLEELTLDRPKCMLDVRGQPLLLRLVSTLRDAGVRDITVVRGYRKEAVDLPMISTVDNDRFATTGEVASLARASEVLRGDCLIAYGDILFRRFVLDDLMESATDLTIVVDGRGKEQASRSPDLVACSRPFIGDYLDEPQSARLKRFVEADGEDRIDGEWIGILRTTDRGSRLVRAEIDAMAADGTLDEAGVPDLLSRLLDRAEEVGVTYIAGHWLDVNDVFDLARARNFT